MCALTFLFLKRIHIKATFDPVIHSFEGVIWLRNIPSTTQCWFLYVGEEDKRRV